MSITPDLLGDLIFHLSDFPKKAKFIGAWFNYDRGVFDLVYEHESFRLVPEGAEYPRREVKTDKCSKEMQKALDEYKRGLDKGRS